MKMIFLAVFVLLGTGLMTVHGALANTSVICTDTTMTIEVRKAAFTGVHEDHLRLNEVTVDACNLHSNNTHIYCDIPLLECGTVMSEDEDNIYFKNEITTVENQRALITRKHLLEVKFYCQYHKRGNVTLSYTAHRRSYTVWEKGLGTFTYEFLFFHTESFEHMIDPKTYPLDIEIGSRMYMQIEATSSVPDTELFVESCRAAPYDNPNFQPAYTIIENGCVKDITVKKHPSDSKKKFRFSMRAFKFIGLYEEVYICCSVMMCKTEDSNTRCSKGCITGHGIIKREVGSQSLQHFISQGPLRLRRSAESTESRVTSLNMNLVFIAGCLLAAVGMISAVVMYKATLSKTKYKPLSSLET